MPGVLALVGFVLFALGFVLLLADEACEGCGDPAGTVLVAGGALVVVAALLARMLRRWRGG